VRVGMEATGYSRWFERLLAELGFEVWMGDPAEIKAKRVKKQKFDREDARLLHRLTSAVTANTVSDGVTREGL
jgi:transposase